MDLYLTAFKNMYNFSDPNLTLARRIDLFLDVANKTAKTPNTSTMAEH